MTMVVIGLILVLILIFAMIVVVVRKATRTTAIVARATLKGSIRGATHIARAGQELKSRIQLPRDLRICLNEARTFSNDIRNIQSEFPAHQQQELNGFFMRVEVLTRELSRVEVMLARLYSDGDVRQRIADPEVDLEMRRIEELDSSRRVDRGNGRASRLAQESVTGANRNREALQRRAEAQTNAAMVLFNLRDRLDGARSFVYSAATAQLLDGKQVRQAAQQLDLSTKQLADIMRNIDEEDVDVDFSNMDK